MKMQKISNFPVCWTCFIHFIPKVGGVPLFEDTKNLCKKKTLQMLAVLVYTNLVGFEVVNCGSPVPRARTLGQELSAWL